MRRQKKPRIEMRGISGSFSQLNYTHQHLIKITKSRGIASNIYRDIIQSTFMTDVI